MRRKSSIVVAVIAVVLSSASGSPMDDLPSSREGTFVQRRTLADVDVTLTSRGVFRFEKDRFFEWETREPVASLFHATPTNYSITVGGRTTTRALAVDVTSFTRLFEIKEMKEFVKTVKVEPETGFPERVHILFKNGDRMDVELKPGHAAATASGKL
ncbi:MAG: hypothetical protein IKO72_03785 [Kiritimatiellae bacterium]|nr:hypothetical protein [Kiritimatiellia bacterium]